MVFLKPDLRTCGSMHTQQQKKIMWVEKGGGSGELDDISECKYLRTEKFPSRKQHDLYITLL